jgi:hypothetical protein
VDVGRRRLTASITRCGDQFLEALAITSLPAAVGAEKSRLYVAPGSMAAPAMDSGCRRFGLTGGYSRPASSRTPINWRDATVV